MQKAQSDINETKLVSVIIPVYNAGKYIGQCVESVLNQTYGNIEIIAVDDGSTDDSSRILREYAERYERIHLLVQENKGLPHPNIRGLEEAHGYYIAWIDADDFYDPTMIEELVGLAQADNADYVYCDYRFYPKKVKTKEKWFKEYQGVCDWHYLERNSQRWKSLTERSLLDSINIEDCFLKYNEYGWLAVLLNAKRTSVLHKELYNYRVGIDSESGGSMKGKVPKFMSGVKNSENLWKIIPQDKYSKELRQYFNYRYIYALLQLAIVAAYNRDKIAYSYAKKELKRIKYSDNPLTKTILDNNHGRLKSFVIRKLIPMNLSLAELITSYAF